MARTSKSNPDIKGPLNHFNGHKKYYNCSDSPSLHSSTTLTLAHDIRFPFSENSSTRFKKNNFLMDSSSASSLQLAMAALVGASLMAISAFYFHKRSVDQVLNRLIEIRRNRPLNAVNNHGDEEEDEEAEEEIVGDGGSGSDEEMVINRKMWSRDLSKSLDENPLRGYRISSSLPNVAPGNDLLDENHKFDQPMGLRAKSYAAPSLDKLNLIPSGLPPLRMDQRDGMKL